MKHFWTNYHSHSHYCDGSGSPEEQVLGAIEQGVSAFGFSTHSPVPFESGWNMKAERLDAYLKETQLLKEKYADRVELYIGLEVDYIPHSCGPNLYKDRLDFTLGSIHYLDNDAQGMPLEIDGSTTGFMNGLADMYDYNIQTMLEKYYAYFRKMVSEDKPDIVGHLDKIKMHNINNALFDENDVWYVDAVQETLEAIAQSGCIVEVNTRGVYKRNQKPYPSLQILKQMKALEIPIMINSDSHHPTEITAKYAKTAEILQQVGYKTVRVLLGGQWQDIPFSLHGLII